MLYRVFLVRLMLGRGGVGALLWVGLGFALGDVELVGCRDGGAAVADWLGWALGVLEADVLLGGAAVLALLVLTVPLAGGLSQRTTPMVDTSRTAKPTQRTTTSDAVSVRCDGGLN